MTREPLSKLRSLCLAFPDVSERLSHGEPAWFLRGKRSFAIYANHHHDQRVAFWCAAPEGAQEMLTEADARHFFRPPYVGTRGWLGVFLDVEVDWDLVASIVEDAYNVVAAKRR